MPEPDDPRFEWIHVPEYGNEDQWIRGHCNHLTPVPVHAHPTGELVAHLCPDCDAQLPPEYRVSTSGLVARPASVVLKDERIVPLSRRS